MNVRHKTFVTCLSFRRSVLKSVAFFVCRSVDIRKVNDGTSKCIVGDTRFHNGTCNAGGCVSGWGLYEGNSISKLQIQVATYVFVLSAGNCHR
jgi:hypothetical protein